MSEGEETQGACKRLKKTVHPPKTAGRHLTLPRRFGAVLRAAGRPPRLPRPQMGWRGWPGGHQQRQPAWPNLEGAFGTLA